MNTKQILLVIAVATGWGVLGLAIYDALEVEHYSNPDRYTRWGMVTTPQVIVSVVTASCIFWVTASYLAEFCPKVVFTLAAIISPVIGAFLYGAILSIAIADLPSIYVQIWAALVAMIGLFFISWPISIGAAVSCFRITRYQK